MTQTLITYQDTALPTTATPVTLFDSTISFPSGCFHLLEQKWFQYSIFFDSAGGAATGVVTAEFSDDKGVTWKTFFTGAALNDDLANAIEVFVGLYKDVRFRLATSVEDMTAFSINMALATDKGDFAVAA